MNNKLILAALCAAAAMVSSCSQDEMLTENPGDAIGFNVSTAVTSRATATTTNTITDFKTYAYLGGVENGNVFMDGVEVSKSGSDWTYSPLRYWPNEGSLDFYSVSPASVAYNGGKTLTYNGVTGSEDLLYALNREVSKQTSAVNVNFRHALSQLVFAAKNTNGEIIEVKVDGVKIVNVKNGGVFTFPGNSTTDKFIEANDNYDTQSVGSWEDNEETSKAPYTAGIVETTLADDGSISNITTTTELGGKDIYSGSLFVMPQQLVAWNPAEFGYPTTEGQVNTYFLVTCSIKDLESNLYIWGDEKTTKEVAVPVGTKWEPGKRYQYTFIFGEGGGFNPGPGPGPGPDPVLVPISFEVTVDQFIFGGNTDVNMKVNVENSGNN